MIRRFRKSSDSRRGQNFVELALLLPPLLVLLMGMMEIGFLIHSYSSVAVAAREAARFGARGLHLTLDEIADVAWTAMEVSLQANESNTAIIVTEIDIDPDGSIVRNKSKKFGTIDAVSEVCLTEICAPGLIDVDAMQDENAAFSADAERCSESAGFGCRNDFVIVEIFFDHDLKMATPFVDFFLELPVRIDQQGIMRVLVRRSPWDSGT
jgi:hypothetical protein